MRDHRSLLGAPAKRQCLDAQDLGETYGRFDPRGKAQGEGFGLSARRNAASNEDRL